MRIGLLALLLAGVAFAATRTVTIVVEDATITRSGSFRELPDGGFHFDVCVDLQKPDGGPVVLPEGACASCAGPFSAATAQACVAKIRQRNSGL
jgi:hypothetical protein